MRHRSPAYKWRLTKRAKTRERIVLETGQVIEETGRVLESKSDAGQETLDSRQVENPIANENVNNVNDAGTDTGQEYDTEDENPIANVNENDMKDAAKDTDQEYARDDEEDKIIECGHGLYLSECRVCRYNEGGIF